MSFIVENGKSEKFNFDILNFIEEEKIFKLSNSSNDETINVTFPFQEVDRSFEDKNMQVFYFHNNYLLAENDVFQVYIDDIRIGWIFPIQSIISEENNFANNPYFNKYKYATYKEILKNNYSHKRIDSFAKNIYTLNDFFIEDIIILCISTETLQDSFVVENFLPSLCNFGYYLYNNSPFISCENNNKRSLLSEYKGGDKIKITPSKINIEEHNFIKNLYLNHLKRIDDTTLKFFLLYQVIEYLIEKEFNIKFEKALEDYTNLIIDKNNFREKINDYSKERKLIKSFTNDFPLPNKLKTDLTRDLKLFLSEFLINYEKDDIGDLIYDLRNILIHRYRDIDILESDKFNLFDLITHQMEFAINHYLINYCR